MEQIFPQLSVATAMAISAAAASPNMGRATTPALVAFMTLLNVRLGYWLPNPGLVEKRQGRRRRKVRGAKNNRAHESSDRLGFEFIEVFRAEMEEIERRWGQVYANVSDRQTDEDRQPTVRHGLVGIGFSGGGIRSATLNLGIAQMLQKCGVFDHLDYMSTVSGGGYLGSSISTLMRYRTKLASEIDGTVKVTETETSKVVTVTGENTQDTQKYEFSKVAELDVENGENISAGKWLIKRRVASSQSPVAGTAKVLTTKAGDKIVWVTNASGDGRVYRFSESDRLTVETGYEVKKGRDLNKPDGNQNATKSDIHGTVKVVTAGAEEHFVSIASRASDEVYVHRFSRFERLIVKTGDPVEAGQMLIERHNTLGERFHWRVRPLAFLREMSSRLDETHRWVNLSDGGHLENLATIELLRRRCKFIIVGDGEADPKMHFSGLATLLRTAYIDLGVDIDIDLDPLRLVKANADDKEPTVSTRHWAIGRITYPKQGDSEVEYGYLLYLKSSITGNDESEVIREYRHRHPSFPHQSTADQFFDEGQFEAYRALGQHIAEQALKDPSGKLPSGKMSYSELEAWLDGLWKSQTAAEAPSTSSGKESKAATPRPKPKKANG